MIIYLSLSSVVTSRAMRNFTRCTYDTNLLKGQRNNKKSIINISKLFKYRKLVFFSFQLI